MTRIKICGLTREQDVEAAMSLGAHMLGFIRVPGSPRYVPESKLGELLACAGSQIQTVLVVQDEAPEDLVRLRGRYKFDLFQFHGNEPASYAPRFGGYPVVHVQPGQPIAVPHDGLFLMDTAVRGQRGGTGKTFDWSLLEGLEGDYLVAGGLRPDNIGELLDRYRPWGVDISSGIEASPGIKDLHLMSCFIENAKKEGTHE